MTILLAYIMPDLDEHCNRSACRTMRWPIRSRTVRSAAPGRAVQDRMCAVAAYRGSWKRPNGAFVAAVMASIATGDTPNFDMQGDPDPAVNLASAPPTARQSAPVRTPSRSRFACRAEDGNGDQPALAEVERLDTRSAFIA